MLKFRKISICLPFIFFVFAISLAFSFAVFAENDEDESVSLCEHENLIVVDSVEATCTSAGFSGDSVCADCGAVIERGSKIEKLPHSFGEFEVSIPAKYKKDGVKVKTCLSCGKKVEAKIPMIERIELKKTVFTFDGKDHFPKVAAFNSNGKKLSKDNYDVSYSGGKELGKHFVTVSFKGNYAGTESLKFVIRLGKVRHLHVLKATKTSLSMTWDQLAGASYYRLEISKNGSDWKKVKTVKGTSATASDLKKAKKYYFRVVPFDASKKFKGETSNEVARATLTSAPTISLSNGKNCVKVSYSPVSGAEKYYIYTSSDAKKWKKAGETKKTSYTVRNLTNGKQIYVRVCCVNSTSMKSAFSSVKSFVVGMDTPKVGPTKNGNISYENGIYYITDSSTGAKFIIVNKSYTLPSTYAPGGLTSSCADAFSRLCSSARNSGINIFSVSTYRSYSYQSGLYNRYVNSYGRTYADLISARPGHSEHQLGLAIDCNSLQRSFGETAQGRWLASHCDDFGFIIRYPKEKTSFTGYSYEPWHIRYLGSVELAHKITDSGLSVEEYYGISSKY